MSVDLIIDVIETMEEWAEYASPYFQQKHNLAKDKENLKEAVATIRALQETNVRSQEKIIQQSKMIADLKQQIEFLKRKLNDKN